MGHFKGSAAGRPLRKPHSNQGSPARYRVWAPGLHAVGEPSMGSVTGDSGPARPPETRRPGVPYFDGLPNAGWYLSLAVFLAVPPVVNTLATGLD